MRRSSGAGPGPARGRGRRRMSRRAAIGSIKANIGHTKAAAGVAGLIKAALALDAQILPPTTGCEQPHPELTGDQPALRVLKQGRPWPADRPLRAGVSAMGFGGINAHVVLESPAEDRRADVSPSRMRPARLVPGRRAVPARVAATPVTCVGRSTTSWPSPGGCRWPS